MPYLKKHQKQTMRSINKEERKVIYDTARWRKLRLAHLQQYPLCQLCQQKGKVVSAIDIHHIISFMSTNDHLKRMYLAYSPDNLMSLCKECHQQMHNSKACQN